MVKKWEYNNQGKNLHNPDFVCTIYSDEGEQMPGLYPEHYAKWIVDAINAAGEVLAYLINENISQSDEKGDYCEICEQYFEHEKDKHLENCIIIKAQTALEQLKYFCKFASKVFHDVDEFMKSVPDTYRLRYHVEEKIIRKAKESLS